MILQSLTDAWLRVFPAAVMEKSCSVNQKLLNERIQKVVTIALTCVAVAFVVVVATARLCPPIFTIALYAMPLLIIPMIAFPFIDSAIAENEVNKKAVNEYLSSNSALKRILTNVQAAQLLVKQGNLNQKNLLGYLLDNRCSFPNKLEIFKLLVDNGADAKMNFELAVKNYNPQFLGYILQKKKISKDDFSDEQQFFAWLNIKNSQTAVLLKNFGFNVNVKDSAGLTPLNVLAQKSDNDILSDFSLEEHIAALVKCGATFPSA